MSNVQDMKSVMKGWRGYLNEAFYTVRRGDNLAKIVKFINSQFEDENLDVEGLLKLNPQIKNKNKIYPGQKIRVTRKDAAGKLGKYEKDEAYQDKSAELAQHLDNHVDEIWNRSISTAIHLVSKYASPNISALTKWVSTARASNQIQVDYEAALPADRYGEWISGNRIGKYQLKGASETNPRMRVNKLYFTGVVEKIIWAIANNNMFVEITDVIKKGIIDFIVNTVGYILSFTIVHELTHAVHNLKLILYLNKLSTSKRISTLEGMKTPSFVARMELDCIKNEKVFLRKAERYRFQIIEDLKNWIGKSETVALTTKDPKALEKMMATLAQEIEKEIKNVMSYKHEQLSILKKEEI